MEKEIKVWYDKEGDYLEVLFAQREGYFKKTENVVPRFGTAFKRLSFKNVLQKPISRWNYELF